jgi:hypothetical protein
MSAQELEFLTANETAKLIRSSRGGLAAARCKRSPNTPPFIRLGRRILYRRAEVMEWLESRRVDPGQPTEDTARLDAGPQGRERKRRRTG